MSLFIGKVICGHRLWKDNVEKGNHYLSICRYLIFQNTKCWLRISYLKILLELVFFSSMNFFLLCGKRNINQSHSGAKHLENYNYFGPMRLLWKFLYHIMNQDNKSYVFQDEIHMKIYHVKPYNLDSNNTKPCL